MNDIQYFEVHVTVEPVEGDRLDLFKEVCSWSGFRVADLIMVKKRKVTEERSDRDQFCTGRFNFRDVAERTMYELLDNLEVNRFEVWRYKIEAVILDVRLKTAGG